MATFLKDMLPNISGYLPLWQMLIACTAVGNTLQCLITTKPTRKIYDKAPAVTPLQTRTFAAWTLTSAVVRFYAAYNLTDKRMYDMALFTYLIAFGHFSSELLIFRSAKINPGVLSPVIVSTVSLIWMFTQYDYYTNASA